MPTYRLKPLAEQVIVISGASSGIGLATARRAARAGARVVLAARNEEALAEAVAGIEREGGRAVYCVADVSTEGWAETVGARADAAFGGFDSWVNDAAAAMYARLEDVELAEHKQVFDTGYFGTVQGSLYAVGRLKTAGGALVNVGSVLSDTAIPVQGAYCAMKHAVKSFTQSLRMETEMDGGRVAISLVKPNGIDTPYPEHARNKMGMPASIPPVIYDPELVARAILFCCEHQRSEIVVGGQGLLLTTMGAMFPRLSELGAEMFGGERAQSSETPPEPGTEDNLFAPRRDGRERSNQPNFVRKTSFALEAQMHPATTAALGIGGAALAAAGTGLFGPAGKRAAGPLAAVLGVGAAAAIATMSMGERFLRQGADETAEPREGKEHGWDEMAPSPAMASASAGIADENTLPAAADVIAPEPAPLDPAPFQGELAAGIADENAVPDEGTVEAMR